MMDTTTRGFLGLPLMAATSSSHLLTYALGALIAYPVITHSLRFRRLRKLHEKYPYTTREAMARMTDEEAFQIQKAVAQLEFPFIFIKSLQFALFRVSRPSPVTFVYSSSEYNV